MVFKLSWSDEGKLRVEPGYGLEGNDPNTRKNGITKHSRVGPATAGRDFDIVAIS